MSQALVVKVFLLKPIVGLSILRGKQRECLSLPFVCSCYFTFLTELGLDMEKPITRSSTFFLVVGVFV
jgi:hypothetical protein